MTNMKKNRLSKSLVGMTLSLSLLTSGAMMFTPKSAHAATVSASSTASNIIATGQRYMGVRYQFGARTGRTDAFDCSSFTQYVYRLNGINIPRSSRQQSQVGIYVPRNQLQPGDLVFFYSPIHHVAIYMGNGKLLHTFGKPGVTITNLNSGWWSTHYTTARRVLPSGQAFVPSVQTSTSTSVPTIKHSGYTAPKAIKHHAYRSSRSSGGSNQEGEH